MGESRGLRNKEKVIVAIGAAVGAGCQRCAENLVAMREPAGATAAEAEWAFAEGLRARDRATSVMAERVAALIGRAPAEVANRAGNPGKVGHLVRLAAAVAANCAPDALKAIDGGMSDGVSEAEIAAAIGIARMVRSKAQNFSDGELSPRFRGEEAVGIGESCGAGPPPTGGRCC